MLKELARTNALARRFKHYFPAIRNLDRNPFMSICMRSRAIQFPVLFDVGANVGQFAIDMQNYGFSGNIYSYEPVANTFIKLSNNANKSKSWFAFHCALGSASGFSKINVSANSGLSSSFLGMGALQSEK